MEVRRSWERLEGCKATVMLEHLADPTHQIMAAAVAATEPTVAVVVGAMDLRAATPLGRQVLLVATHMATQRYILSISVQVEARQARNLAQSVALAAMAGVVSPFEQHPLL